MAQYPSDHEPRPRHSTTEDVVSDRGARRRSFRFDDAYTRSPRGRRPPPSDRQDHGRHPTTKQALPKWAVVSPGVFRAEHFLPLDNTYLSLEGNLVVPFDKRTVSRSPRAERDHVLSPITERALEQYYQLAA